MAEQSRRTLRFTNFEQVYADVDRLIGAEQAGRLVRLGNWTLGQAVNHVAAWGEYAFTPPAVPPLKWYVRLLGKLGKAHFLKKGLSPGFRFKGIPEGTIATEVVPTDVAWTRLHRAFDRLNDEAPTMPNELFGHMKHDEWKQLQLRHAELHLSFFVIDGPRQSP